MIEEDANPLMALLAHQAEPTELDKHFGMKENKKDKASESSGPIVVVDESEDNDDAPIGLVHRQPSFSSLHGPLILKDGEEIPNLPQVTEDTQETKYDSANSPPADISSSSGLRRQSSYATLMAQVPVAKTEVHPPSIEPIAERESKNYDESGEEDEEEDYDPQVIIVKQLKDKNKERWQELGYQPPRNLVSIVRTASQASYTLSQTSASSTPMACYGNELKALPIIEDIHEEQNCSIETENSHDQKVTQNAQKVTKIKRTRCGSDGMKLGEASSSMALMEAIICENPSTIEVPIEQVDEPEEDYVPASDQSSSESDGIVDRIIGLVENGDSSTIYTIKNRKLNRKKDFKEILLNLENVIQKCTSLGWNSEVEYIVDLIESLGIKRSTLSSLSVIYNQRDKELEILTKKFEESIAIINSEYAKAAEKLDQEWHSSEKLAQFSKPSSTLLNLRKTLRAAESQKEPKYKLDKIRAELMALTEREAVQANQRLKDAYYAADVALKTKYAERKAQAYSNFTSQCNVIEQRAEIQTSKMNFKF